VTDIEKLNADAEYLTGALKAFREASDGLLWSIAMGRWVWTPAFNDLPAHIQDQIDAAAESARQRVNRLAGA